MAYEDSRPTGAYFECTQHFRTWLLGSYQRNTYWAVNVPTDARDGPASWISTMPLDKRNTSIHGRQLGLYTMLSRCTSAVSTLLAGHMIHDLRRDEIIEYVVQHLYDRPRRTDGIGGGLSDSGS